MSATAMPELAVAAPRRQTLNILLWIAQAVAALVFFGAGMTKLTTPIVELAKTMPWAGDYPLMFVRAVAVIDLAGAVGLLLPALTRIWPRLTVWAAIGCIVLQAFAIALHVSRREFEVLPLNAVLVLLVGFVAWGRSRGAVIAALEGQAARRRLIASTIWAAQVFVALVFLGAGMFKLSAPITELAAAMKWPGEFPQVVVRLLGAIDIAGALGILLPALTRIQPRLTLLAAIGCAVLQVLAIGFHISRGEWSVLPLNFMLLPCALYVLWARARLQPIEPRS